MGSLFQEALANSKEVNPQPSPMKVNGVESITTPNWIDPDTVKLGSQAYRVKGYNAPEVPHIKGGVFVPGEDQGASAKIPELAQPLGYNNIVTTGDESYTRKVGDIQDKRGNSLSALVNATSLAPINKFTSPQDLDARAATNAFAFLNPKMADKDPAIAAGIQAKKEEEQRAQSLNRPLYMPKVEVFDEAQYAGFKRSIGHQAVKREEEEIARLEKSLKEDNLPTDLRASLEKRLEQSRQTIYAASTTPDFVGGVMMRSNDRTIMNQAHDQATVSFYNGLYDIAKGVGGVLQMTGDKAGWEWLSKRADQGVKRLGVEQNQMPDTLSSFRDINTGGGAWDTIGNSATYVGNLVAGTLPQMVVMAGAAMATGGTGASAWLLSSAPSTALYSGQFYADQPDDKKNAGLATSMGIASGILDKLGLDFMMGKLGKNMFTAAGHKELVQAVVDNSKKTGINLSKEAAEQLIETTSKSEILKLAQFSGDFAKRQIAGIEITGKRAAGLAVQAGGESATEAAQQYAQAWGESGSWSNNFKYARGFEDQILEAAVGGGVMGGAFHASGSAMNAAQWHSAMSAQEEYRRVLGESQVFQAENANKVATNNGGHRDILSLVDATSGEATTGKSAKLADIPSEDSFRWSKLLEPGRLVRQLAHTAIPSIVDENGALKENLGHLKAIMGGYGILPGDHASGYYQRLLGKWSGGMVIKDGNTEFIPTNKDSLASMLGVNTAEANKMVRDAWVNYWSKGQEVPNDTPQGQHLNWWKNALDETRTNMLEEARVAGADTSMVTNSNALFESSKIIPSQIVAHKNELVDALVSEGATPHEAQQAVTNIVSGNKQKASLARHFLSEHKVFSKPELAHLFESNVFDNIEHVKETLANNIMRNRYIGKEGEVIGKLLLKAKAAGEFGNDPNDTQFKATVSEVKAWVDIMNGDYHSLRDYPNLQKLSNFFCTATMLSSLGKAALSSQVETYMATLGTPAHLISKQLATYYKEYGSEIASDLNKGNSWATSVMGISMMRNVPDIKLQRKLSELYNEATQADVSEKRATEISEEIEGLHKRLFGRSIFHRVGLSETGFDAASKFEYQDSVGSTARKMMGRFASLITLRAQTDANRLAVISVAGDILSQQLVTLSTVDPAIRSSAFSSGKGLTNEQAQALTELQQYGLDVNLALKFLEATDGKKLPFDNSFTDADLAGDPELQRFQDQIFTVIGNFVDARVVNPQAHNTPKIYNDPRWKAITLMQKFMATAHAVILPRLYKQYLKEGHAGMKYSAFATMAGSLLAAQLINQLKDFLSYDEERDNPYLKTRAKKAQRTLNTSGLLGQFEKITDKMSPVIPNSGPKFTNDPAGWGVDKIKDMSPVASWTSKVVGGTYNTLNGNTEKGVKQLVRAAPVVGSFPRLAKDFVSAFKQ